MTATAHAARFSKVQRVQCCCEMELQHVLMVTCQTW